MSNGQAKFIPVTDLKVGDRIAGGLVTATRRTAKRVYVTYQPDGNREPYVFYQGHLTRITVFNG